MDIVGLVAEYGREARFSRSFDLHESKKLLLPHHDKWKRFLYLDEPRGVVYVIDSHYRIHILDCSNGKFLRFLDYSEGADRVRMYSLIRATTGGSIEKALSKNTFVTIPRGIALDQNGCRYIIDAALNCVVVLDSTGKFLRFFGENDISNPTSVSVHNGFVAVNDDSGIICFSQLGERLGCAYADFQQTILLLCH